ncbi:MULTISPECIES: O-antigen polymerase [Romboutsia]|jgi:oligosaccharide repeat unit polymerase|nr:MULTISPECIES: O-antigen polymerase [Romboutsia]
MVFISIITEKKKLNPLTLLFMLWTIIIGLSYLRLFRLREASEHTYLIIMIGLTAFTIGYYFVRTFIRDRSFVLSRSRITHKKNIYEPRYKLLYIIGGICILFYLYDLSIVLSYILRGSSLAHIRELAQDPNSVIYAGRSAIENSIRVLVITPFVMALQPIVAADFWLGRRDKKLIVMDILIILLRVITDGSRVVILYLLLHLLVAAQFTGEKSGRQKIKLTKKNLKKAGVIGVIIAIGGYALYKTTLSRSGDSFVRYMYYYFSMQPYMFEIWSNIVDNAGITGYGLASTNGFMFAFLYIIKNFLGLQNYPEYWYSIYSLIGATDSHWQVIAGDATIANAYVSIFWFFYLDGRIFGIIIGMAIYGMICARTFMKANKQRTARSICIYSIILQGICFSFVRLQFADIYYAIAVIFILIFAYKKTRSTNCQ